MLTVGHGNPEFVDESEHLHWGPVSDDRLLALFYSAADLLAFPSLQEGFGQTILEALACGLPVVGFDTGGMRDAIRPGITGYIAQSKTADALADALQVALEDVDRLRGLSQACRETAEPRFSVDVVARRYQELYRALVARQADTLISTGGKGRRPRFSTGAHPSFSDCVGAGRTHAPLIGSTRSAASAGLARGRVTSSITGAFCTTTRLHTV